MQCIFGIKILGLVFAEKIKVEVYVNGQSLISDI